MSHKNQPPKNRIRTTTTDKSSIKPKDVDVEVLTGAEAAPETADTTAATLPETVTEDTGTSTEIAETTTAPEVAETPAEEPQATQPAPTPVSIPQLSAGTPTPVAEQPVKEPTVDDYFAERYPNMVDIPVGVKAVMETLEAYNYNMHPGRPMDPQKATQFQRALYYGFLTALGLPGRQSQLAIEAILWYFNTHRQYAFSQHLLFRPINTKSMAKNEIDGFRMLLHLFFNTADPKTRKANLRSMVEIRKVVESLPNTKCRESLLNFYA